MKIEVTVDNNRNPSILIVDDLPKNLQVLGGILQREAYLVAFASNGRQALATAPKIMPDLILLDIMMPDIDGYEVCRQLKESTVTRDIPVIFITAKVEIEDIIKGLELGAVDYVKKPFNATELLARVKTHIELKFSRERLEEEIKKRSIIQDELERANNELQRLSNLDGLTKIANRRHFDNWIKKEGERTRRENTALSLIMCDVDHFKNYNDTYGHQMGDTCLQSVAGAINSECKRPGDLAARYGGEEFAIILPSTIPTGAMSLAKNIKNSVDSLKIPHKSSPVSPYITLSLGVATITDPNDFSISALIQKSDEALYLAKEKGRNCIIQST